MPLTIHCTNCGVKLNLPTEAQGRKVKCPKCGLKFVLGGPVVIPTTTPPSSPAPPSRDDRSPDSTFVLTRSSSNGDLPVMPNAPGDLRETFDLPLMMDEATSSGSGPGVGRDRSGSAGGSSGSRGTADALALFDEPAPRPKKRTGAEGRATARRCPTCGGVVPQGMSICKSCGLDLETGSRVDLMEDLAPPPPPRGAGMPIAMTVIGCVCAAVSAGLGFFSLYKSANEDKFWLCFVAVAGFGVFAAVQFLRCKSVKPLLLALSLGALIDFGAFVFVPIYKYNVAEPLAAGVEVGEDPDATGIAIYQAPLDLDTLKIGFTVMFLIAALSIYLLSPQVSRAMRK